MNSKQVPMMDAALAFPLNSFHFPLLFEDRMPKTARFEAQTRREPPKVPVNSYHWTQEVVLAKAFPRTSQGQLI